MKYLRVLLFAALFGVPGMCAPVVEDAPALPELKMSGSFMGIRMKNSAFWGYDQPWNLDMGLNLENSSDWHIAWCDEAGVDIVLEDSKGSKSAAVLCNFQKDGKEGRVRVDSRDWVPSAGARWVGVKGSIPFAVSCRDGVSESVTVKLEKGVIVPVVLKDAGTGVSPCKFEEAKACLQVMGYSDASGMKGKKWLTLCLSADRPLGVLRFDLQGMDGLPLNSSAGGMMSSRRHGDRYYWDKSFHMDEVKEGVCRIGLSAEGRTFDFEGFELVDEKGAPVKVDASGKSAVAHAWVQSFRIKNAGEMKKLRVRMLYPSDAELVSVPVDLKMGLNGPLPHDSAVKRK